MDSNTLCNYGHKIGWLHHQKCNLYHANGTIYQNLYTMHNKVYQSFLAGLKVVPKIQTPKVKKKNIVHHNVENKNMC